MQDFIIIGRICPSVEYLKCDLFYVPEGKRFFQTLSYMICSEKRGKEKYRFSTFVDFLCRFTTLLHCGGRIASGTYFFFCSCWLLLLAICTFSFQFRPVAGGVCVGLLLRPPKHSGTPPNTPGQLIGI